MPGQESTREQLASFMAERHAIYMRKALIVEDPSGSMSSRMKAAWDYGNLPDEGWTLNHLTRNVILHKFRFTNVYRELDKVTVWIRENIREPYWDHPNLWFMLATARHINWPGTLQELMDCAGSWSSDPDFSLATVTAVLQRRQDRGDKVYTGAYMIRAEQYDHPWRYWPKVQYSSEIVLGRLWERRHLWAQLLDGQHGQPSLFEVWSLFQEPHYTGWGPFMAYQVIVDMRWTRYLCRARDINEWAAVGPGSARGLNRLHGRPVKQAVSQGQGLDEMLELREWMRTGGLSPYPWLDLPELSDVQNCLCEFDKYERVRLGEGRPRALYVPGRGG